MPVVNQEDAPGTRRIVHLFEQKNDIIVNLTFSSWELLLFLISVFNYLYFRNCATDFVEIYNIYASQMVIKVAVSIINLD